MVLTYASHTPHTPTRHLHNLHALVVRARRHEVQALLLELADQLGVHLEAVAVALRDLCPSHALHAPTLLLPV